MVPLTLASNRALTLGALAYAASESPPAARPRAELASVQKQRRHSQRVGSSAVGASKNKCTVLDSPAATYVQAGTCDVRSFVGQEVEHGVDSIVDGTDAAGGDSFDQAGQLGCVH